MSEIKNPVAWAVALVKKTSGVTDESGRRSGTNLVLGLRFHGHIRDHLPEWEVVPICRDQQPLNLQTQLCRLVDKSTRKMLQLLERARQLLIQEKRRRNNNPKHQTP